MYWDLSQHLLYISLPYWWFDCFYIVLLICKSLWIKASTKSLNVIVIVSGSKWFSPPACILPTRACYDNLNCLPLVGESECCPLYDAGNIERSLQCLWRKKTWFVQHYVQISVSHVCWGKYKCCSKQTVE